MILGFTEFPQRSAREDVGVKYTSTHGIKAACKRARRDSRQRSAACKALILELAARIGTAHCDERNKTRSDIGREQQGIKERKNETLADL